MKRQNLLVSLLLLLILAAPVSADVPDEAPQSFTEMAALGAFNISKSPGDIAAAPVIRRKVMTFYTDREVFEADAPNLPTEDFESGSTAAMTVVECPDPLTLGNEGTCFPPDTLLPGFAVASSSGRSVVALGAGVVGQPSTAVAANFFGDYTLVNFSSSDVYAVGFDLFGTDPGPYEVVVNDSNGGSDSIFADSGFVGVVSDTPITRIDLLGGGFGEVIDNLSFGTPIPPMPCALEGLGAAVQATTGDVNVSELALINSYESCDCLYSAVFDNAVTIQAAGSVNVDASATVNGAVASGVVGDPMPEMIPDGISLLGNLEIRANETVVLAEGDYYYDSIAIKDNSRLETTGHVRIWFRNRLEVGGNAPVRPLDNRPAHLTFFSTYESSIVEVKSGASLIGSIFAPNVNNVRIQSNAEVFGVVVGASVDVQPSAIVHGDSVLCDLCPVPAPTPDPFPSIANALDATAGISSIGQLALVDSYDSCVGPYGGANILANGGVQALFSIDLHPDANVNGTLSANTESNQESMPIPNGLTSSGTLLISANESVVLPAGDYLFDDITLKSNATLQGDGLVRIWFTGSLNIAANSVAEALSGSPADLWFFGGCGAGEVEVNQATVLGTIHTPDLPVLIRSNATVFGAIVGSDVEVRANANVHFDEALIGGCS